MNNYPNQASRRVRGNDRRSIEDSGEVRTFEMRMHDGLAVLVRANLGLQSLTEAAPQLLLGVNVNVRLCCLCQVCDPKTEGKSREGRAHRDLSANRILYPRKGDVESCSDIA